MKLDLGGADLPLLQTQLSGDCCQWDKRGQWRQ